jgi:hypothetical protein
MGEQIDGLGHCPDLRPELAAFAQYVVVGRHEKEPVLDVLGRDAAIPFRPRLARPGREALRLLMSGPTGRYEANPVPF